MIEQITSLLEKNGVSVDIITAIKSELADGFQISDVVNVLQNHKDSIPNHEELLSQVQGLGGVSDILDKAKDSGAGGLLDKAKGFLGM
jgi:hypothetical protein